jgi:glycerophosphoryl diester phosphodiesterase
LFRSRLDSTEARPGPLILAHRGACRAAPENTLAAFRLAMDLGADGVELDVRLSADGDAVVHHDADLRRTAGRRERIAELRAAELAGVVVRGAATQTTGIPTLRAVLDALPAHAAVDIEIKEETWEDDRLERRALEVAASRSGPTLFSSASTRVLERLRGLQPAQALALVVWDPPAVRALERAAALGAEALVVRRDLLSPPLVTGAASRGLALIPYNADSVRIIRAIRRDGAAAVITNRPEIAWRALRGSRG